MAIPAFSFGQGFAAPEGVSGAAFNAAKPFPHAIIDNFLPENIAGLLAEEFPARSWARWRRAGPGHGFRSPEQDGDKVFQSDPAHFGPLTRHVMNELNGGVFLETLADITGIAGLVPDPTFSGCGQHSTGRGGRLLVHVDADRHPIKAMRQRLNLILFLNPDWDETWGGHLELWSQDWKRCVKKIEPTFNRAVIFLTARGTNGTMSTPHGHPEPLQCPPERRRNTLAVYYYTVGGPEAHSQETPWRPANWKDALLYWDREKAWRVGRSLLPPALIEFYAGLRGRR